MSVVFIVFAVAEQEVPEMIELLLMSDALRRSKSSKQIEDADGWIDFFFVIFISPTSFLFTVVAYVLLMLPTTPLAPPPIQGQV